MKRILMFNKCRVSSTPALKCNSCVIWGAKTHTALPSTIFRGNCIYRVIEIDCLLLNTTQMLRSFIWAGVCLATFAVNCVTFAVNCVI